MPQRKKYLHTIRFRVLLITVSFTVLISAVIAYLSYRVVSRNVMENWIQGSEAKLSFLCSSIDANIDAVRGFATSCKNSGKVKTFLLQNTPSEAASDAAYGDPSDDAAKVRDPASDAASGSASGDMSQAQDARQISSQRARREARELIQETYSANPLLPTYLVRLVIASEAGGQILQIVESPYSVSGVTSERIRALPYFGELRAHPGDFSAGIQSDPFVRNKDVPTLPFLLTIQHPFRADGIGYVFAEISLSAILGPMESSLTEAGGELLFQVGDARYAYADGALVPYEPDLEEEASLTDLALRSDTEIRRMRDPKTGKTSLLLSRPLRTGGLTAQMLCDERELQEDIGRAMRLILGVILASAGVSIIVLSWFLNRTIHVPVKALQKRMERIAKGDFSRDPETEWDHELGDIGKNINDLAENILTLMDQRIEDERQKKDYEYKMLQSQINPHFLYNTLNSIKWMATAQNASGIAEMATALSRLMKNISKGTATRIPLREELALIDDYFTIQQYRYGGVITLTTDVEEEALLSCPIPRFTLQPIVENAIFHGIEPKGSAGTIAIRVLRTETGDVRIDVTDDGVGMSQEVAERLLEANVPSKSSFFKEIGVQSVHKRIQYEFGEAYGLSVRSEPGKYTTVSILLPPVPEASK